MELDFTRIHLVQGPPARLAGSLDQNLLHADLKTRFSGLESVNIDYHFHDSLLLVRVFFVKIIRGSVSYIFSPRSALVNI